MNFVVLKCTQKLCSLPICALVPRTSGRTRQAIHSSQVKFFKMTTAVLKFDAITNEDRGLFDGIQSEVLSQLQQSISSDKGASGEDNVGQFVTYLTTYNPEKLKKAGYSPADFTWNTWKVFTYTAACIPPDHIAQSSLVQILLALQAAEAPWKDLPEFGMFMRDEWNESEMTSSTEPLCTYYLAEHPMLTSVHPPTGPTFEAVDQSSASDNVNRPELSLDEWVNLNAFIARIFRDVDSSFRTFGIWELRSGLEGDATKDDKGKPLPQASVDTKVRVAAEWIIRAGDRLWKDSLLGVWADSTETRAYVGGDLIPATNGLNLERWGFWKRRFAEVRGVVQDQAAKEAVGQALEVMTALEKKAAEAV